MDWKDILIRLVKTFIQGFLGALAITIPTSMDSAVIKSTLIASTAAGLSAVMNVVSQMLNKEE